MSRKEIKKHARAIAVMRGWVDTSNQDRHDFNPNRRRVYNASQHHDSMEVDKAFEANRNGGESSSFRYRHNPM